MSSSQHQGDEGYTGILGEGRIPKSDPRLELLGTLDEVSAALGMVRASGCTRATSERLQQVQRDLYAMMSEVSSSPEIAGKFRGIDPKRVEWLNQLTENVSQAVKPPNAFIIPGDTFPGAVLDYARTVTRRAERRMVESYLHGGIENQELLKYLNRLSLLCFFLELYENQAGGKPEPTLAKSDQE